MTKHLFAALSVALFVVSSLPSIKPERQAELVRSAIFLVLLAVFFALLDLIDEIGKKKP